MRILVARGAPEFGFCASTTNEIRGIYEANGFSYVVETSH